MAWAIGAEPPSGHETADDGVDELSNSGAASSAVEPTADGREHETAQKADAERDRLLTAAMEVLQRSGWWGFKVESVLRQARLSTRSFYRHFEKKSDLLLALLEFELSGATIKLRRVTAAADTPSGKVRAYVAATIDMAYREDLAKPSSLFASHWRELLPEYPEVIDRRIGLLMAPLVEAIQEGKAYGELHSDDPEADARAIFFLVAGMTADQASLGGLTPREDFEHIVMPFISRAIGLR
jgi:AcrR family transcriptional regulator